MDNKVVCITNTFFTGVDTMITLEKRQAPRVDLNLECIVNFSSRIRARSVNISETGICLFTDDELADNQFVTLLINLQQDEMVKAICQIIWYQQLHPLLFQYGLKFWDFEAKKAALFKDFIRESNG